MRFLQLLAAAALALALTAPAAGARVACTSGTTVLVDGRLRIFAIPFHDTIGDRGYEEYACLGAHGRPLGVGSVSASPGTDATDTPAYVLAGGRYLAVASDEDGEGGLSSFYDVYDLRTRHRVTFTNALFDLESPPEVRLSAAGELVTDDIGEVEALAPGGSKRVLSTPGAQATGIALSGSTVYWTEGGVARSAALAPAPAGEDHVLAPVSVTGKSVCASRPGTTVARSPHVRVTRSFACRVGDRRRVVLPTSTGKVVRIAGDRWVYAGGTVIDMRTRRTVTRSVSAIFAESTLLEDGTLAWIDDEGLWAARPRTEPVLLSAAATALASSHGVVYWTADGVAHRWAP